MTAKLITTKEVAKLAGVRVQTIRCYRCRGTIPEPSSYVGSTPVWRLSDIQKWIRERPGPGRPTK
jgi:predicted DNA-binding transcriptional regulator AlpA